jgi:hypothetical protein
MEHALALIEAIDTCVNVSLTSNICDSSSHLFPKIFSCLIFSHTTVATSESPLEYPFG